MRFRIFTTLAALLTFASIAAVERESRGASVTESSISANSTLEEADAVFKKRDYQSAVPVYQNALKLARKEFNRSVEVEALSQLARCQLTQGNKEEGRPFIEQAAERASDTDPMGWSRFLGVRGRFEWQDDDLTTARQTFGQLFDYCTANALQGRAVDAANMIAIVSEAPEEQIKWGRRGIEVAEATDEESLLGPLWNNLAGVYYDQKQFDSALECYLNAREYHWRFSGEIGKLYADYHVGMTYRLLGKLDEAAKWLRPVLAWAERLDNHSAIGQACEDLGEIAIARGNKADGIKLLERARSEYKAAGFDTSWKEVWEHINSRLKELS